MATRVFINGGRDAPTPVSLAFRRTPSFPLSILDPFRSILPPFHFVCASLSTQTIAKPLHLSWTGQITALDDVLGISLLLLPSHESNSPPPSPPITTSACLDSLFLTSVSIRNAPLLSTPGLTLFASPLGSFPLFFTYRLEKMSQGQGDIQERIAAARREAESLKEKIRAKREQSADTSCTSSRMSHGDVSVDRFSTSACDGSRG